MMKKLKDAKRWFVPQREWIWRRVRIFAYTMIGKDPYPPASYGSLMWKIKRGKPLTAEEQCWKDKLDETARRLTLPALGMQHAEVQFQMDWLLFAVDLLDNIPRRLRDNLSSTPVREAKVKVEMLLPLASYQRERTSIKFARYALFIGTFAFLISIATLAVAICTLAMANQNATP